MRLRLASYNLHKCRGTFGPYAPEQNLAVIAGLGADIVALSTSKIPARQSVVLVCMVMLVAGLVLYFINKRLTPVVAARGAQTGTADGPVS